MNKVNKLPSSRGRSRYVGTIKGDQLSHKVVLRDINITHGCQGKPRLSDACRVPIHRIPDWSGHRSGLKALPRHPVRSPRPRYRVWPSPPYRIVPLLHVAAPKLLIDLDDDLRHTPGEVHALQFAVCLKPRPGAHRATRTEGWRLRPPESCRKAGEFRRADSQRVLVVNRSKSISIGLGRLSSDPDWAVADAAAQGRDAAIQMVSLSMIIAMRSGKPAVAFL
jgi:hypothetical protein